MPEPGIASLVQALPELYQPVYGHPEFDEDASRPCTDRLAEILKVVDAMAAQLGRPLRVLDIGCAQGYFSLSLARTGAQVTGIDMRADNVALCNALAAEHPSLITRFLQGRVEDALPAIVPGEYDVVLALSVVHHLCHEAGAGLAAEVLGGAAGKIEALLVETALRSEPLYWAPSLPLDPRELLSGYPFVHPIGVYPTHLSSVSRPLLFASARWCYLGGSLLPIESWTDTQHELAGGIHQGTRRYFFSGNTIAKYFLFRGEPQERNRMELAREVEFLATRERILPAMPVVYAHELKADSGWLVREMIPGQRLSQLMQQGAKLDRARVVRDVLDQLCALEAHGRYHGDVRIWNVIVGPDGRASLIDFGDIVTSPQDCAWPGNVFLAFVLFVHEVYASTLPRALPARSPFFSPEHFAPPYREWVATLWSKPVEQWTFEWMRAALDAIESSRRAEPASGAMPSPTVEPSWNAAIEGYLDTLGQHQHHLNEVLQGELIAHSRRVRELERLLGQARERELADRAATRDAEALRVELTLEQQRLAAALRDGETWRAQAIALEAELAAARSSSAQLLADLVETRGALKLIQAERDHQRNEAGRWWQSAADLTNLLSATRRELVTAEQERDQHKEAAATWWGANQLSRELRSIYDGWSWRVTAPLRIAKRLARGVVRFPLRAARRIRRGIVEFVSSRPRLKSWLGERLDRYPNTKARLKTILGVTGPDATATPSMGAAAIRPAGAPAPETLSPDAQRIYRALRAGVDRRRGNPLDSR